jgi:hypothetical protein
VLPSLPSPPLTPYPVRHTRPGSGKTRGSLASNKSEAVVNLTRRVSILVNEYRTARVAEILADFRTLQYYIAAAPVDPPNMDDYYTEGWAALRQCAIDGQHILNVGADVSVPRASGGPDEQAKAELKQYVLLTSLRLYRRFPSKSRGHHP